MDKRKKSYLLRKGQLKFKQMAKYKILEEGIIIGNKVCDIDEIVDIPEAEAERLGGVVEKVEEPEVPAE